MPAWSDYKKHAQEIGSLAFEVYVAVSSLEKPIEEFQKILPEHIGYVQKLEREGHLMCAGPLSDTTGELMEATGMLVIRANSLEKARELIDNDPAHKAGIRTSVIRRWLINEGRFNISVGLSTGSVDLS